MLGIADCFSAYSAKRGGKILRVLRVTKLMKINESLISIVNSLVRAFGSLTNALIFLVFILYLFSLIGVEEFKGDLYARCRNTPTPINGIWQIEEVITRLCNYNEQGDFSCPSGLYCGHPSMYTKSLSVENVSRQEIIYYGLENYDNPALAFLTTFRCITFDGWVDIMYKIQDSDSQFFAQLFFTFLIILAAFFALNLILAVLVDTFQNSQSIASALPSQNSQTREEIMIPINEETGGGLLTLRPLVASSSNNNPPLICNFKVFFSTSINSWIFDLVMAIILVGNIVVLSFNRWEISNNEIKKWDYVDIGFVILYFIEFVLKIVALGIKPFFGSLYGVVDFTVVVLGVVEIGLAFSGIGLKYASRCIIVTFRSLRIFKLIYKWEPLAKMVKRMSNSLVDVWGFGLFLLLFMVMYAVIGMDLFQEKWKSDYDEDGNTESYQFNFDTFGHALLFVFSLVIGDSWSTMFHEYGRYDQTGASFYFVFGIAIFNILMVNLFIAILLQNFFHDEEKEKMQNEDEAFIEQLKKQKEEDPTIASTGRVFHDFRNMQTIRNKYREKSLLQILKVFRYKRKKFVLMMKVHIAKKKIEGDSLNLFSPNNKVRKTFAKIILNEIFEWILSLVIIISSLLLAFQSPLNDPNSTMAQVINWLDISFGILFGLEIIMKVIVFGLVTNGPNSYLREAWNIFDFSITMLSYLEYVLFATPVGVRKFFRYLRVLRLLRIVNKVKKSKVYFNAIFHAFPELIQIIILSLLIFLFFGLVGIQLFKGWFYECDYMPDSTINTIYDCMNKGGYWKNEDVKFIFL